MLNSNPSDGTGRWGLWTVLGHESEALIWDQYFCKRGFPGGASGCASVTDSFWNGNNFRIHHPFVIQSWATITSLIL